MRRTSLPPPQRMPRTFDALVRLFPPRSIRDAADYRNIQEVIDRLTSIPRMTRGQAEYLDTLSVLFEAYEAEHHGIDAADISAVDALRFLMEQNGMSASDLGRLLGDRSLGSRILRGKRQLSKAHIRTLCDRFGVSAELFLD